nr:agmatine deiminase family protein [Pseudohalocynthiibacter aestuariivivens]
MNTPKSQGYSMPPEWAPHARTWMMWPCREIVWDDMQATRRSYANVAHAVARHEPLTMLVRPQDMADARDLLGSDIELLESPIDDSWCRDAGPCFVTDANGAKAGVNFRFNAWGEKYSPFDGDDRAASAILNAASVPIFDSKLIAEGGGVNVDGRGTILTTETCFPNANRNPDWSLAQIEAELMEMLGGTKVIWLPGSELEVETNGHVDGIAAFMAPGLVLMEGPTDEGSDWDKINARNVAAMQGQTDATGAPITIRTVPPAMGDFPHPDMFCSSYVNSYICNDAVIMPEYGVREDDIAAELFQDFFPDRTIERVNIDAIAIGGGGIHCITQQEPA